MIFGMFCTTASFSLLHSTLSCFTFSNALLHRRYTENKFYHALFLHFCRRIHCKHFSLLFKIIATSFILSDINWVKNKFSFEPTQRTKTLFQLNILNFIIYFFFVCVCGQPEFFYLNASIFYLNTSHFT